MESIQMRTCKMRSSYTGGLYSRFHCMWSSLLAIGFKVRWGIRSFRFGQLHNNRKIQPNTNVYWGNINNWTIMSHYCTENSTVCMITLWKIPQLIHASLHNVWVFLFLSSLVSLCLFVRTAEHNGSPVPIPQRGLGFALHGSLHCNIPVAGLPCTSLQSVCIKTSQGDISSTYIH